MTNVGEGGINIEKVRINIEKVGILDEKVELEEGRQKENIMFQCATQRRHAS